MKEFWVEQAKTYKHQVEAVNFDPLMEELELHYLSQLIPDGGVICDLGCGNGRTILQLGAIKKKAKFYGVDFVKEMVEVALEQKKARVAENVEFFVADASSKEVCKLFDFKFDFLITKRLLINLKGKEKLNAVKNIYSLLKDNGTYLMIECFLEPLERINKIRSLFKLEQIKVKIFNEYLEENFIKTIDEWFKIKEKFDFGSLYYFTSRVYNAALVEGNPDYFAPINKLSVDATKKCPKEIMQGYSPEVLHVFKRK